MDSRFERGDVIAEKNWIGQTIQYVVLDTVFLTHNFIYSQNGYISTLPREQEHYYAKIGHIDLKPLWKQIKDIGK